MASSEAVVEPGFGKIDESAGFLMRQSDVARQPLLGEELVSVCDLVERWIPRKGCPLSMAESRMLALLRELGPTTMGVLARHSNVSQPTMSNGLARLQERQLVGSERSLTDHRLTIVSITPAGLDELELTERAVNENIGPALAALSTEDRARIQDGLEAIKTLINSIKEKKNGLQN